jgi:hypothetical protein
LQISELRLKFHSELQLTTDHLLLTKKKGAVSE